MTVKPSDFHAGIDPSMGVVDRPKRTNQITGVEEMFGGGGIVVRHPKHNGQVRSFRRGGLHQRRGFAPRTARDVQMGPTCMG